MSKKKKLERIAKKLGLRFDSVTIGSAYLNSTKAEPPQAPEPFKDVVLGEREDVEEAVQDSSDQAAYDSTRERATTTMPLMRCLSLSTYHIRPAVCRTLETQPQNRGFSVYVDPADLGGGVLLRLYSSAVSTENMEDWQSKYGLDFALLLMRVVEQYGCQMILFTNTVDPLIGLPVFDWS